MQYETGPQVARRWGVSRIRVFQLIKQGRLVAERIGRDWIVYGYPNRDDIVNVKKRVDKTLPLG